MRPLRSKLPELYGEIENGVWADQSKWMVATPVPAAVAPYWRYNRLKVSTIYCHKQMLDPLLDALRMVEERGIQSEIKSFDGIFAIRKSRRGTRQSVHSWGLAIDINAEGNRLGQEPTISRELVSCFETAGFVWGGRWTVPDGMHFQYVTED